MMNYIKNSVNLAIGTVELKKREEIKTVLQTYELDENFLIY